MDDNQEKEFSSIKKNFIINNESTPAYEQKSSGKSKGVFLIIGLLLIILIVAAVLLRSRIKSLVTGETKPAPIPTTITNVQPVPTPNPLVRSDWSFEVLNGSGTAGLAKTLAFKIQELGYQVVKIGNADQSNYPQTEILVKKNLLERIDLVIADLKDIIKIASVAGELKEGTASARIIIGQD